MSKYKRGVCPECKVKEADSSKKALYQCKFCGRWFCAKHFEPKLAFIKDLKATVKYPEVRVALEKEWRREDGHPDFAYSLERFQELDMEEKLRSKLIEDALNRSKAYRKKTLKATPIQEPLPAYPDIQTKSKTKTQCPKCGSGHTMYIAYREKFSHLQCLDCGFKWKQPKLKEGGLKPTEEERVSEPITYRGTPESHTEQELAKPVSKKLPLKKIVALLLVTVILVTVIYNSSSIISFIQKSIGYQSSQRYSQQELVNYALSLINSARQSNGVQIVSLGTITSAQQHADNMLKYGFFSHWDMNGYKPHMRYTLAEGKGSVSENIAWNHYPSGIGDVKEAIKDLERALELSFWHWANIVTAFHNKVSIGIAYDNDDIYLVQNFENDYITWSIMSVSNGEVTMSGTFQKEGLSIQHVAIYYDKPMNLTVQQLNKPPYNASYDVGTYVGMALPSGWESIEGITITAKTWYQVDRTFEIRFNLSPAFNSYGKGVYTLCLQSDLENTFTEDNSLTSYSVRYD